MAKIVEKYCLLPFDSDWWIEQVCSTFPDISDFVETLLNREDDLYGTRQILAGKCLIKGAFVDTDLRRRVIEDVIELALDSPYPTQRSWCIGILVQMQYREVGEIFSDRLSAADPMARKQAAETLGQLSYVNKGIVKGLLQALSDSSRLVSESAIRALGQLARGHEEALLLLLGYLHDTNAKKRAMIVRALGYSAPHPEVLTALLHRLEDDQNEDVRAHAAGALGNLGSDNPTVVEGLVRCLSTSPEGVREATVVALGKLPSTPTIRGALHECLLNGGQVLRGNAAQALGMAHAIEEPILEALIEALNDEDDYIKGHVLNALKKLLPLSPAMTSTLRKQLESPEENVRWLAYWSQSRVNTDEELQETLIHRYPEELSPGIRSEIVRLLGNGRRLSPSLTGQLLGFLVLEDHVSTRIDILRVLSAWGTPTPRLLSVLLRTMEQPVTEVRAECVRGLGLFLPESQKALNRVIDALDDPEALVRRNAAETLGQHAWEDTLTLPAFSDALTEKDEALAKEILGTYFRHDYVPANAQGVLERFLYAQDQELRDLAFCLLFLDSSRTRKTIAVEEPDDPGTLTEM